MMKLRGIMCLLIFACLFHPCSGQTYEQKLALHRKMLNNVSYSTEIRPLKNQSHIMLVVISFDLISIVGVDDVSQSFTCNAYVSLYWRDEILAWNPEDHGNSTFLIPKVKDIWKPRMTLINTLNDRDPFKDDLSPLNIDYSGNVSWFPGGLLTASCALNMKKFPFDVQECLFIFEAMNHNNSTLQFCAKSENGSFYFYSAHSEWDVKEIRINPFDFNGQIPVAAVTLIMARRPGYFMGTTMAPMSLLSILNFFAFVLPADSGERVGFGMTVLLSQGVFLSTMTGMLPRSSSLPSVTYYVLFLLLNAAFITVIGILVVYLHHVGKNQAEAISKGNWRSQRSNATDADGPSTKDNERRKLGRSGGNQEDSSDVHNCQPMTKIAMWINLCSFVVSSIAWISMTSWFFVTVVA